MATSTLAPGEGFAAQQLVLGPAPAGAVTWFQQGDRTVATLAERIAEAPFGSDEPWVMATVMLALAPATLYGFWLYGWPAIYLWFVTVGFAAFGEVFCLRLMGRQATPVLLDGTAAVVAGLVCSAAEPGSTRWFQIADTSPDPVHRRAVQELAVRPVLDLGMHDGNGAVGLPGLLALGVLAGAARAAGAPGARSTDNGEQMW